MLIISLYISLYISIYLYYICVYCIEYWKTYNRKKYCLYNAINNNNNINNK